MTAWSSTFDLPDLSTPPLYATDTGTDADTYIGYQFLNAAFADEPLVASASFFGDFPLNSDGDSIGSDAAAARRDAVTAALMRRGLANDYITGESYATEWVITFPTRYLSVDFEDDSLVDDPFTKAENLETGEACEVVQIAYYDHEEAFVTDPGSIDFSPGGETPQDFQLCYEVNVLAVNQSAGSSTAALKSKAIAKYVNLADGYDNGWADLDFEAYELDDNVETGGSGAWVVRGLPVLGFAAVSDSADAVPRGATFPHHLYDGWWD